MPPLADAVVWETVPDRSDVEWALGIARMWTANCRGRLDRADAESDALYGLACAAKLWNAASGVWFRHYARPRVVGEIQHGLRRRYGRDGAVKVDPILGGLMREDPSERVLQRYE